MLNPLRSQLKENNSIGKDFWSQTVQGKKPLTFHTWSLVDL